MPVSAFRWRLMTARSRLINTAKIAVHAPFVFRNWTYFFSSRFQKKEGILEFRNGMRFHLRPASTDRSSLSEVFILDVYKPVPKGSVVIDVGANIGAFTLAAAQRAKTVYALEPVGNNFEALRQNVELNGGRNISLHRLAMSGNNGEAEISVSGTSSSIYLRPPGTSLESVRTITLESFLDEHQIMQVDFLKMDCEGAEWDILLRTPASVLCRIRHIELEFHNIGDSTHPRMLEEHLAQAGFRSTSTDGNAFNGLLVAERS